METNFDEIRMVKGEILGINYTNLWDEDPDWIADTSDITDTPISKVLNIETYINESNI
jgi:hypothetical protein